MIFGWSTTIPNVVESSSLGTTFWSDNCPTYSLHLTSRILTMQHGCGRNILNFPLHPDLRPFAGVDITHIKSRPDKEWWDKERTRVWEHWDKNFTGLTDSSYQYLKLLIHVNFIAYGDRKDALYPLQWSHSKLNLPGDES